MKKIILPISFLSLAAPLFAATVSCSRKNETNTYKSFYSTDTIDYSKATKIEFDEEGQKMLDALFWMAPATKTMNSSDFFNKYKDVYNDPISNYDASKEMNFPHVKVFHENHKTYFVSEIQYYKEFAKIKIDGLLAGLISFNELDKVSYDAINKEVAKRGIDPDDESQAKEYIKVVRDLGYSALANSLEFDYLAQQSDPKIDEDRDKAEKETVKIIDEVQDGDLFLRESWVSMGKTYTTKIPEGTKWVTQKASQVYDAQIVQKANQNAVIAKSKYIDDSIANFVGQMPNLEIVQEVLKRSEK